MVIKAFDYLSPHLKEKIKKSYVEKREDILEIRLRVNQPIAIITRGNETFIKNTVVTEEDLKETMLILTENSLYALERQFQQGFITIAGGHRVGFTGQVITENNNIKSIKNINSINFRLSREVIGIAKNVAAKIYNYHYNYVYNTLIISPPICGKTTLLRDLVRLFSNGDKSLNIKGKTVGLVDERSEIAGAYQGIPQNNIGKRTDVLDNCPKSEGMLLLIRAMSPELIAVDELGRKEDIYAVKEAANAGVSLITTIHGQSLNSIKYKPGLEELINENIFKRFIILSRRNGAGTIEEIIDNRGNKLRCG